MKDTTHRRDREVGTVGGRGQCVAPGRTGLSGGGRAGVAHQCSMQVQHRCVAQGKVGIEPPTMG